MRDDSTPTGSGVPPPGADHAGDTDRGIPRWVERSIWTDRMLGALANGVQGGKWFCLIDKVASVKGLDRAWQRVRRKRGAGGVDGQTIGHYDRAYRRLHPKLSRQLREGSYQVQPVRRVWIPKPGKPGAVRPLGIPTVVDRVVQMSLRSTLEPIFEKQFHPHSYGFRPERSTKDALHHVARSLRDRPWVVDADLASFFDTINHDRLMGEVGKQVSDGALLRLLRQFLEAGVLEHDAPDVRSAEKGTPQGGVISPLLANIYLNDLDHVVNGSGYEMVRYADDFVILCRTEAEAQAVLTLVRSWVEERHLTLHPEKTRVVDMSQEEAQFDFLGFTLKRSSDRRTGAPRILRLPRQASIRKLRDGVRAETRRCNGRSLEAIVNRLNPRIVGWGNYFRTAIRNSLVRQDQWIRMRLRSILRKRSKRRGRGRGRDHNRWPNAYFARVGLASLAGLHDAGPSP